MSKTAKLQAKISKRFETSYEKQIYYLVAAKDLNFKSRNHKLSYMLYVTEYVLIAFFLSYFLNGKCIICYLKLTIQYTLSES